MDSSVDQLLEELGGMGGSSTANGHPSLTHGDQFDRGPAPRSRTSPFFQGRENHDQELPLDIFDQELLNQPYDDRRRQAEDGRARLSLAPNLGYGDGMQRSNNLCPPVTQENHADLSRFAYQGSAQSYRSSSPPIGMSSSPALRVSRRKNDGHNSPSNGHKRSFEQKTAHPQDLVTPPSTNHWVGGQSSRAAPQALQLSHAPTTSHGHTLISVRDMPDRFRGLWKFPVFNAIQSQCFPYVYETNDNFVLSSPTGSGKTVVLELAICRAVTAYPSGQFKIVYQAPTKSLCAERQRDWEQKFRNLGLTCAELTGDTDQTHLKRVQSAHIIVTTPEKWDSITRKWKDHMKLLTLIKLVLIDEVHILGEDRGATLEAIVSRMKTIGTDVRFVALSATIPNSSDIAAWLGKNSHHSQEPAALQNFGEEFRPVVLKKHVRGYQSQGNDFVFEQALSSKLIEVVSKYSQRKPIMIFCSTRSSSVKTATLLANWWTQRSPKDRLWGSPTKNLALKDPELRKCVSSGVAFHNAGIDFNDRTIIESAYLSGELNVICCTSTLAVGINLPCHLVIIKGTTGWQDAGSVEYTDLEIMQMLGRAGRPQFDKSGIAVIMTRQEKTRHYEKMVSGQETLESKLHLNLTDHMNAEIGLGTVYDRDSAKQWLMGTFLFVRLQQNPDYYRLEGVNNGNSIDQKLACICDRGIDLLQDASLVSTGARLKCTEYGDAMARYYVQYETMLYFIGLRERAKLSEILPVLASASEFKNLRVRATEKSVYKKINSSPSMKFPIQVDIALYAHKISIIIQSVLGGIDFPDREQNYKTHMQYNVEKSIVFRHVIRFIRCLIDIALYRQDAVTVRNALLLERSFGADAWDDSPLQLKQLETIGPVALRKLVSAGVRSIGDLEIVQAQRIETIIGRPPPYGLNMLERLKRYPKPRVSAQVVGHEVIKDAEGPTAIKVRARAEIGFLNENVPVSYGKKAVYVCFMAEISDGRLAHFARTSATQLGNGKSFPFTADLTSHLQSIVCYVMCDGLVGTMSEATLKPNLPEAIFANLRKPATSLQLDNKSPTKKAIMNTSRPRNTAPRERSLSIDEFGDADLDDNDLVHAVTEDVKNGKKLQKNQCKKDKQVAIKYAEPDDTISDWQPTQLSNGKWECNHRCKNKRSCKHLCCRDGLEKAPTAPKKAVDKAIPAAIEPSNTQHASKKRKADAMADSKPQAKIQSSFAKGSKFLSSELQREDLTQKVEREKFLAHAPKDIKHLQKLHKAANSKSSKSVLNITNKKPKFSYGNEEPPQLDFLRDDAPGGAEKESTDYSEFDDIWDEDIQGSASKQMDWTGFGRNQDHQDDREPAIEVDGRKIADELDTTMFELEDDDMLDFGPPNKTSLQECTQMNKEHMEPHIFDDSRGKKQSILRDSSDDQDLPAIQATTDQLVTRELSSDDVDMGRLTSSSTLPHPSGPPLKEKSLFVTGLSSESHPSSYLHEQTSMSIQENTMLAPAQNEPSKQDHETYGAQVDAKTVIDTVDHLEGDNQDEKKTAQGVEIPPGFEGVDPWLIAEFGDVVEFV